MADEDKDFLAWKTLFQEQIDFFRQKLNLPTERWDDLWQAAHDRAFVVAGAQSADLLADLRSAVDRAIAGGGSIGAFRKEFAAIVQKHGWVGFTGDGSKAGIAWRTRVIYQTNMATSYAAGRWQQLNDPDLVKLRPYWQYIHADGVMHPRPLHLSWHGLTLPREHAFWQTHFPPNGWGCRCRVRAVGKREYDAAVAGGRGPEAAPADDDTAGIDPGWAYAPGANASTPLREFVQNKLITYPVAISTALSRDVTRYINATAAPAEFARRALTDTSVTEPLWLGFPGASAGEVGALVGHSVDDYTILLPSQTVRHVEKHHGHDGNGQRPPVPEDYAQIWQLLDSPDSLKSANPGTDGQQRVVVVKAFGGEVWRAVFEIRPGKRNRSISLISLIIKT